MVKSSLSVLDTIFHGFLKCYILNDQSIKRITVSCSPQERHHISRYHTSFVKWNEFDLFCPTKSPIKPKLREEKQQIFKF